MMFGGRGSMGGGGGGGGMMRMRTFGRAVPKVGNGSATATGPHDQFPSPTASSKSTPSNSTLSHIPKSSKTLSLSSAVSSSHTHTKNPICGIPIWHRSSSSDSEDCDWVSVDGIEDEVGGHGFYGHHCVLGSVPSENEVEDAVYALQHVFRPASHGQHVMDKYHYAVDNELHHATVPCFVDQVSSSDGTETDWDEPSLFPYNSTVLQADGLDRVYYAFHLLQTEPSVQRMVKSLSTDKAVWDAVLNNEAVQELKESFSADDKHVLPSPEWTSNGDSLTTTNIVMMIFDIAKAKLMEVIQKITNIVNELFQPAVNHKAHANGDGPDPFNERLKTSFMLSIMVLLVVVVNRAQAKA